MLQDSSGLKFPSFVVLGALRPSPHFQQERVTAQAHEKEGPPNAAPLPSHHSRKDSVSQGVPACLAWDFL